MANSKPPLSFDEVIQSGRNKRKAEVLAQEIFGKNRKPSTLSTERRTSTPGGSLASRVGVNKRSNSSSSLNRQTQSPRSSNPSSLSRSATADRLEKALTTESRNNRPRANGKGGRIAPNAELNIRGAAGPYTVVAQNFAPGTTAADIESVMQPFGGAMISCKVIAARPTVIAELVFAEKQGADKVISTFNNQKADGRLLYVHLKKASDAELEPEPQPAPRDPTPVDTTPTAPVHNEEDLQAEAAMEVDRDLETTAYQDERFQRDALPRGPRDGPRGMPYNERYERRQAAWEAERYGPNNGPRSSWQNGRGGDSWRSNGGRGYYGGYGGGRDSRDPRGGW
ncbi:hypothetical protein K461DRAFT_320008 [Myriangium duriaei CBS 260.36]|uniref:RRM domain-containing protein n=1 Tax=Myriangium duriaei CBS 260.36 TaxID=1168546 RepID=A0A9P4MI35_9PEZI|nr:hypothetical protein K461DRAFT_320008 [Myriangium duriaei CBS 260.36]